MKLKIVINMDNDAFRHDWTEEVGRILNRTRNAITASGTDFIGSIPLHDTNGNLVGFAVVEN